MSGARDDEGVVREFVHVRGTEDASDRAGALCRCCRCGRVARCVPTFDFYGGPGQLLACEVCVGVRGLPPKEAE